MHQSKYLSLFLASAIIAATADLTAPARVLAQETPRLWGEPLDKTPEPETATRAREPRGGEAPGSVPGPDSSPASNPASSPASNPAPSAASNDSSSGASSSASSAFASPPSGSASGAAPSPASSPALDPGSNAAAQPTPAPSPDGKADSVWKNRKSAWNGLSTLERTSLELLIQDYRRFLGEARTELMAVAEIRKRAEARGFKLWSPEVPVMSGDRLIFVDRDRSLVLVRVGSGPMSEGVRVTAAHIDSPRIELKGRPFYQAQDLVLFQTTYHGGMKKYQWVNVPLALVGRITRRDGTPVDVRLGLEADDPVFVVPDTAPHEDKELRERKQTEVIKGEELDPVIGSYPEGASPLASLLARVKEQYQIDEEDMVGAELSLVPAMGPRDVGFDRSMVGAYGQDDKACSFAAVRALLDQEATPRQTTLVYLSANEEVGSNNNTGADSFFLRSVLELLNAGRTGSSSAGSLYQLMSRSLAISADTTTGVNPLFPGTQEESNASRLGFGVVVKLYGNGNNPSSETTALIRRLLFEQHIPWQTQTPRVDVGGGGTIGNFLSRMGMDVIDMGIPVLSQHAPFELSSKVDVYDLYQTLAAFNNGGPSGSNPGAARPEEARPDSARPEGARPEGTRSEGVRPEGARPQGAPSSAPQGGFESPPAPEPERPVLHP